MKNNISKHVQLYEFYGFGNCAYKLLHYLIFNLLIPLVLLNPANWMSWVRVDNVNRIFNPLKTYVQKYNIVQNYKELLMLLLFFMPFFCSPIKIAKQLNNTCTRVTVHFQVHHKTINIDFCFPYYYFILLFCFLLCLVRTKFLKRKRGCLESIQYNRNKRSVLISMTLTNSFLLISRLCSME